MTPQVLDGEMIEPRVSVPIAKPTRPADVAAAGPADDPLELRSMLHGLCVLPPNQTPPCASAPIDSFATSTAPASRSRSTTVASRSMTWFSYGLAPQVVLMPLVANRSFAPHGMPCSWPAVPAGGDLLVGLRAACASASSSVSVTTHLQRVAVRFSRARYIFVRSVDDTLRLAMSGASAVTGWNASSSRLEVTADDAASRP